MINQGDKFAYINAPVALYFATYFNLKFHENDPLKYADHMNNAHFSNFIQTYVENEFSIQQMLEKD
jgi:hypothetical protein